MKKYLCLVVFFAYFGFSGFTQDISSRQSKAEKNYTGKRFDSSGRPLDKKYQRKKSASREEYGYGDAKRKAYPIGMDKNKKKKRKSNYRGKGKKKSCNCPGK